MLNDASSLLAGASLHEVENNGATDYITGSSGSNAFRFSAGQSGDDVITNFTSHDTLLIDHKLFDANNDGVVSFGTNHVLDMDRTSKTSAGRDQITLRGLSSNELRFLGSKDGSFIYADASTRQAGWEEGTVGDDAFVRAPGSGPHSYLFDNALGLNLGHDTISIFNLHQDYIITTAPLVTYDPVLTGVDENDHVYVPRAADQIGDRVIRSDIGFGSQSFDLSALSQKPGSAGFVDLEGYEDGELVLGEIRHVGTHDYYVYHIESITDA